MTMQRYENGRLVDMGAVEEAAFEASRAATLEELARGKLHDARREGAQRRLGIVLSEYNETERESWPVQAAEADAVSADPQASVVMLSAAAAHRWPSQPVQDGVVAYVAKVQEKRLGAGGQGVYLAAVGAILTCRHRLEGQIKAALAAEDRSALEAIDPADAANWPA